jgi:hypothetical protein
MESLATEEVSTDDDKEGVSSPELVEDCVPDLERDAGAGREKTGSALTKKSISGLHREANTNSLTGRVHTISTETMFLQAVA